MTTLRDDLKTLMAEIPITHEEIRQFKENLRPGRMIYSAEPVEYIDKLLETFITNKSPGFIINDIGLLLISGVTDPVIIIEDFDTPFINK